MGFGNRELPVSLPLYLDQGSEFTDSLTWSPGGEPMDFTGCTARMAIRQYAKSTPLVLLTTTSSSDGSLVLSLGTVTVNIKKLAVQRVRIPQALYDIFVDLTDGTPLKLFAGPVLRAASVTP